MSPKRRAALAAIIFGVIGVGVSLGIIASGGGFSSGASIFNPPTDKDIFHIGQNIQNGTTLVYLLNSTGPDSTLSSANVSMVFQDTGKDWKTTISIQNGTSQAKTQTLNFSRELTVEGAIPQDFRPYFSPVESSILAVRDMSFNGGQPKYFVVGAPWDTLVYGSSFTTVRITSKESVNTNAGSFDSYVLTFQLQNLTSKIWFPREMPFPVKAQVYDPQDHPYYSYDLYSYKRGT